VTALFNRPEAFQEEMLEGFLGAYGRYVQKVDGAPAVMRARDARRRKVAVVLGGGSGHYPSFAGFVGEGLGDAAVVGNVFTSPSAEHVYRTIRAVESGAGVLLCYGRYSGDVMNFGLAQDRAVRAGLEVRTVLVTDDVASAPPGRAQERRGIAGDFCVFKVAGASAERGDAVEEVERLALKANSRVRSLGVAFGGCTLPGAGEPLFSVASGTMELGLGIHGEPGVKSSKLTSASGLARVLVDALVEPAEVPEGVGPEATVVLNGLGCTKYEELFVLYRDISACLRKEGVVIIEPEVGEFVTSLDMAGCSLTLMWVDDELKELWAAPAQGPGYRKGGQWQQGRPPSAEASLLDGRSAPPVREAEKSVVLRAPADSDSKASDLVRLCLINMLARVEVAEDELGRLDAIAGDGDHGRGMVRGLRAAVEAASPAGDVPGEVLIAAGEGWAEAAGGSSGALWGAMLVALGRCLVDGGVTEDSLGRGLRAAVGAVSHLGGAQPGDKTMLDALVPFVDKYMGEVRKGKGAVAAWACAVGAGEQGAAQTAGLISRRGRSAVLGERSRGVPDPGAVSLAYCLRAVGETLGGGIGG
jgi:dihydroxyacetone kinase